MRIFTLLGRHRAKRPRVLAGDRLAVYGRLQNGPLLLARTDLDRMPEGDHAQDVAAYARGEWGRAVSLRAICDLARPVAGTLYVRFEDRVGRNRVSHFLAEVRDLGWIAYAASGDLRPREQGGIFRLILPGIPIEVGRMSDLAWIEFADEPWD